MWKRSFEKIRGGVPPQSVPDAIAIPLDTLDQSLALERSLKKGIRSSCKYQCFVVALCQTGDEDHYVEVPELWTEKFFQSHADGLREARKEGRGSYHLKTTIKITRTSLSLSL